jgi:hypothetical protein
MEHSQPTYRSHFPQKKNLSLPLIEVFNISYNFFRGSHPTLSGSPQLVLFDAGYNLFVGQIDTSICNSSGVIRVLRFTSNLFTGDFPTGFGNCTKLEELYLDINGISGSLPDDLFRMPSLTNLSLQENQLSGRMSPRFSNLSRLARLDISFNSFTGHLPNIFGSLGKLEYFSAQSNFFRGPLPSSLSHSPLLKMLYLPLAITEDVVSKEQFTEWRDQSQLLSDDTADIA